uniref:Uncharacterized protein n=1 Tax=Anguilla anguilla TaxID=7936 RepID=A0A0E9RW97_ANGAN
MNVNNTNAADRFLFNYSLNCLSFQGHSRMLHIRAQLLYTDFAI